MIVVTAEPMKTSDEMLPRSMSLRTKGQFLLLLMLVEISPASASQLDEPSMSARYRPKFNSSLEGRPFRFGKPFLDALHIPPTRFVDLTGSFSENFVLATAASADHFEESVDSVASVQKHFPHRRLLYFDLGLTSKQASLLMADGGGKADRVFCNVEYRTFDFDRYPPHVRNLFLYSWKFLIIKEVLEEFGAVFWIDSSVRFKTGNFMQELEEHVRRSAGILLFTRTSHSNYAVTHEDLYQFFPSDLQAMKKTEQWEGGNILVYNTKEAYSNVLQWMYYCVLDPDCIAPGDSARRARGCRFGSDRWQTHAGCHRFDQATLNLLLANWHEYETDRYTFGRRTVNEVMRYASKFNKVQWCEPLPSVLPAVITSSSESEPGRMWSRVEL